MKIYNGTTWQESKSLKIHNGSTAVDAIKGWVYDSGWKLGYPNYPSSSGITLLYSGTLHPTVGTTWSVMGNWKTDPADVPTSYTYQWKRGAANISGATSPTYTTVAADVDSVVGVTVVATNARGSTTMSQSVGAVTLPTVSNFIAYDSTPTPTASISLNVNGLSYSGSWSSTNASSVSVTSTNGQIYPDSSGPSGSYTGTGTANPINVSALPINTNKKVYMSWSAAPGAASYDVVKYGNNITTIINVPSSQTNYTWDIATGNETNVFSVYPKSAAGSQGYGASQTVSTSNKTGAAGGASSSLYEPYPTAPTSVSGTDNSSTDNGYFSWSASTSPIGRTITGYSYTIYKSGSFYTSGSTTATNVSVNDTGSFSISVTGSDGIWNSSAGTGSGTFTVKAPGTPSPSTYSISYNSFSVSWSEISGASAYSVKVGTYSGGNNILDTTTPYNSYGVSSLSESTPYYVTVAAYKPGYGYGSGGTASATTTANPTVTISTPTQPTFYRNGTTMKWGFDNPSWTGPLDPFGVEWEIRSSASSGGTLITGGNTRSYNTTWISSSGLASIWHYIVGTHASDLPATSSARYLRFRLYGQNTVTYAIVNGPWSAFV